MYNFRTDLALERREIFKKINNIDKDIPGIESIVDKVSESIKVEKVRIVNSEGEKALQKPIGDYITIDVKKMRNISEEELQEISQVVSNELKKLINKHIKSTDEILVVGLGNLYSTPDSLGSKVVQEIDVTRHIFKYLPQYVSKDDREVSAIAPGVLGTTGIETQEILKGIVDNINPKLIIAIDSLSSNSIERISSTVQLSDTGIVPGGGVNNKRKEISKSTLGVPVISIGIPTVVELATLVSDGIDIFIDKLQEEAESNEYLNKLQADDKYETVKEALNIGDFNMIVTPKEIDELVENMKDVIARGINFAIN